ncbi:FAD binding domain-containing protein [Chachezhania sediminis]|uniref:FAD binding domain-containing protein n=1 Tax=Chachezhania sediminis TaxID=2599291 RepID=UPI00131C1F8F|nr:xanthine dehydrogenase family protein subunit M [Chachezhania sediminis]
MRPFDFVRPTSVDEALAAWEDGAAWLGGGTNLVDLMKTGAVAPTRLIDLSRLPGMRGIEVLADGSTRIGALVGNSELANDPDFAGNFPMVAEAILSGASGQIRNAATVAGNVMQHPREAWFHGPASDPLAGDTGKLAVLGTDGAPAAVNPSDFCVPLVALGAVVEIVGPDGTRDIPVADLHRMPTADDPRHTTLTPGELILALRLPPEAAGFAAHSRYLKVRDRTSFAFALTSAAACMRIEDGKIAEARLTLGAVAPRPWRVAEAEDLLKGQTPGPEVFATAAELALDGARAVGGNDWKIDLARRTALRALDMAAAGTPAEMPALPASVFGTQRKEPAHA